MATYEFENILRQTPTDTLFPQDRHRRISERAPGFDDRRFIIPPYDLPEAVVLEVPEGTSGVLCIPFSVAGEKVVQRLFIVGERGKARKAHLSTRQGEQQEERLVGCLTILLRAAPDSADGIEQRSVPLHPRNRWHAHPFEDLPVLIDDCASVV